MLNILGTILVLAQFAMDGFAIYKGMHFESGSDVLIWFLTGLIGVILLIISQAWMNARVNKAERKADRYDRY